MSILINAHSQVLIQGITGSEGARAAREMRAYGMRVVAGVTPGKGGQLMDDVPVYNTVREALAGHQGITASLVAVPAPFAADAALEAIWEELPLVNILTEHVPVGHAARVIAAARSRGVRVVGPSSVGIISPGKGKIGAIGAGGLVDRVFMPGPVGVMSKSGGMTAEISRLLTTAGFGQSTAVGLGGDMLIGSTFLDLARLFERDRQTRALVIFGEVGGVYEEQLAEAIQSGEITKPVVALIAGDFSAHMPLGTVLGHAGAIVSQGKGSAASKIQALKRAGARVAKWPEDIPRLISRVL